MVTFAEYKYTTIMYLEELMHCLETLDISVLAEIIGTLSPYNGPFVIDYSLQAIVKVI